MRPALPPGGLGAHDDCITPLQSFWKKSEDQMAVQFDREAENLGNITALEHVNVEIPDQALASSFYLVGCGFTRDPYLFPGTNNMWVNIGKNQFHLPTGEPLVFRGHIGVVSPDREALLHRLQNVKPMLKDTKFG